MKLLGETHTLVRLEHPVEPPSQISLRRWLEHTLGSPSDRPRTELGLRLQGAFEPGAIAWISGLRVAGYTTLARKFGYQVVFDEPSAEADALFDTVFSSLRHWPEALRAARCAYWEERFCSAAHAVVTTSQIDAARIRKLVPGASVHVLPCWTDLQDSKLTDGNADGPFVTHAGSDPHEHARALRWFGENVLPRLKAAQVRDPFLAQSRILVAGLGEKQFQAAGLALYGFERLASAGDWYQALSHARGAFFPGRRGQDCRLSIVEAMSAGVPVICTGRAAEGLSLDPGQDVLLAERPDAFTSAWVRLLQGGSTSSDLARKAIETVRARYDWRAARPVLESLLQSLD